MLTPEEELSLAHRWRDTQDMEAAHKLVTSHLRLVAKIPGADKAKFAELVGMAKAGCPVSRLLNAKITLEATLL